MQRHGTLYLKGGRTVKVATKRSSKTLSLDTAFPVDEGVIHRSILAWLQVAVPEALVFHIPNEGKRSEAEGARMKALGLVAGMPDLALLLPGGQTAFLEIKTQAGKLSPEQRAVHHQLSRKQHHVAVVRSIEEARVALRGFGIGMRDAA